MMLSASGGIFMAKANDLIVVFLGLEILSIALYVLAGYHRRRSQSQEAAIKYFVLGSFSSAFFLYGIALTYGATGSTNITEIGRVPARARPSPTGVLLGGVALLLVGLGFKVAAVPFHMWTPDVYQGSPTPVTGFMAAAAKTAGFAALLRIFFAGFGTLRARLAAHGVGPGRASAWWSGSVLAVVQTDVKRMLAYSSISHAGYVLIGLQAATDQGIAGSLFYLLAYTFMILGSFAIVTMVGREGDGRHALDDYRGLARDRPGLALAFTVFLLAQAGVPFTSGFLAKFGVIAAAVESRSYALAVIAMLAAVIAAFFYLRVIVVMYMSGDAGDEPTAADGAAADAGRWRAGGGGRCGRRPPPPPRRPPPPTPGPAADPAGGRGRHRPLPGLHHRRRPPPRALPRPRPPRHPPEALTAPGPWRWPTRQAVDDARSVTAAVRAKARRAAPRRGSRRPPALADRRARTPEATVPPAHRCGGPFAVGSTTSVMVAGDGGDRRAARAPACPGPRPVTSSGGS